MFITIHCGGMPFDGNTIKERSLGGSETAAYYMAKELAAQGHKVTLFTRTEEASETDGVRYIPMGNITEAEPLGDAFHHYSANTIVDVLVIQRHPLAFQFQWASKVNLLWLHDLATVSTRDPMLAQMPFIDGVLTVSEWHKKQVVDVWGLEESIVLPIQNGVDLSLYEGELPRTHVVQQAHEDGTPLLGGVSGMVQSSPLLGEGFKMLYTSRPERGLENLVRVGGIMEQFLEKKPEAHLYVCNYDNVMPHVAGYYSYLYERCHALPNVTLLGHLTKQELADVQRQCNLCIYPTSFEETSCITAMECMAAGLPLVSSAVGALPETVKGSGAHLIPTLPNEENYRGMELRVDGKADNAKFVEWVCKQKPMSLAKRKEKQLHNADKFAWSVAADMLLQHIDNIIQKSWSAAGYMKECLRNSDIYALKRFVELPESPSNSIAKAVKKELDECYGFINDKWGEHYAAYYEYEKARGVDYGPESLDYNPRFEHVSSLVGTFSPEGIVLDYGCAHGHYTINLAKRFPHLGFIGIDITPSNIEKARAWAKDEELTNVMFYVGSVEAGELQIRQEATQPDLPLVDCVIAAEVLEHLESPATCADALAQHLKPEGKMIITVPYGPWEAQGYQEHWPWRAHVHHLDRADLWELYGHHKDFAVVSVPSGVDASGDAMGSYVATYSKPEKPSGAVDYTRKLYESKPRQTLSLCMIARDAQETIERCLHSAVGVVDEVIVGIDKESKDETAMRIDVFCKEQHIPCTLFDIESPTVQGFDEARNQTIEKASGDWILWMDSDEVLNHPERLARYLRNNQFNGYAIAQHHFSMEPAGVMKTDYPVRVFRNNKGIKFFGVVHEHPEKAINKGVGHAINIPGVEIGHYGYQNEDVRRKRFQRNIGLLLRDREKNPQRRLGKFLWLRDLAQMCGFDLQAGSGVTDAIIERAHRGMEIFEELLHDKEVDSRLILDALDFYSPLAAVLEGGFEYTAQLESHRVQGHFHKKEHLRTLVDLIINEKVKGNEQTKYQ